MATVITNFLTNGINPSTVGGTGTTIKYFQNLSGNFTSGVSPANVKNNYLFVPDSGKANGQRISVRAGGNFTIGTGAASSPTVTVGLYPVTFAGNVPSGAPTIGSAIVSSTLVGSSDLVGYYPFAITSDVQGDNTSGLAQLLSAAIVIDGTATTASTSVILSNVNMLSAAPFAFVVGVTFSVSDPGASANLYQFDLSL